MTDAIMPQVISRAEAKAFGLKRYFTGRPCKHGHVAERLVSDGTCLECRAIRDGKPEAREYHRRYNAVYDKAYYAAHADHKRASRKRYRAENPEKVREALKDWRKRNADHVREYTASYCARNREQLREKARNNPEACRVRKRARKARMLGAAGAHTIEDIAEILKLQRSRCALCKVKLGEHRHVDHIIALSRGGSNDRRNLQILCPSCNRRKHAKDPIQFAKELGKLL